MRDNIGLYRGKREDNSEWHYGYLYSHKAIRGVSDLTAFSPYEIRDVIPETVGQCSGVPDKNSQLIFEGDIVESRASENPDDWKQWFVVFEDGCFEFTRECSKRKKLYERNILCKDEVELYGLVVVGNIHDSPEITKENR